MKSRVCFKYFVHGCNFFHKMIHLRCLIWFWISLCNGYGYTLTSEDEVPGSIRKCKYTEQKKLRFVISLASWKNPERCELESAFTEFSLFCVKMLVITELTIWMYYGVFPKFESNFFVAVVVHFGNTHLKLVNSSRVTHRLFVINTGTE